MVLIPTAEYFMLYSGQTNIGNCCRRREQERAAIVHRNTEKSCALTGFVTNGMIIGYRI